MTAARARCAAAGLVAALAALGAAPAAQVGERVAFCADPRHAAAPALLPPHELDVARLLARELHVEATFVVLDPHDTGSRLLSGGGCDALLGAIADPGPLAERPSYPGARLTRPYYATGYLMIRHPNAAPLQRVDDAGDARIAVEGESVANYALRQRGRRVHVVFDHEALVETVAAGRAPYGYVWGPVAGPVLLARRDVSRTAERDRTDQWEFAIAVVEENAALRAALNGAIDALLGRGAIAGVFAAHGIPFSAPQSPPDSAAGRAQTTAPHATHGKR